MDVKDLVKNALSHHQSGQFVDAEKIYLEILKYVPDNTDTLNFLGILKIQCKQAIEAIPYLKKAIELKPSAYYLGNLAQAYFALGSFNDAITIGKMALELDENDFDIIFNLALAYKNNNQFEEAVEMYKKTLQLQPDNPDVYFNMANTYDNWDKEVLALEYYQKAKEKGVKDENIDYFIGVSHLKNKNFKEGWKYYEARMSRPFSILTQKLQYGDIIEEKPFWQGEDLKDKTLFVYYEAGFGDSIMYARYLPILSKMCKKVIYKPQFDLTKLFIESDLNCEVLGLTDNLDDFDFQIPLMSIPYILQHNNESQIPHPESFLKSNFLKAQEYRCKYFNNEKFKIGIKWQGNPSYDRQRIIPLSAFYKLFDLPNTQFCSLQKDDGSEELNNLPQNYELLDLGPTFNNFSDTAAAIQNLDLVICNDTSVAHLAAAMGKSCWVLLPYNSNWRWHNDISYSSWYKSVKLFKQVNLNSWDEVFEQVYQELKIILPLFS